MEHPDLYQSQTKCLHLFLRQKEGNQKLLWKGISFHIEPLIVALPVASWNLMYPQFPEAHSQLDGLMKWKHPTTIPHQWSATGNVKNRWCSRKVRLHPTAQSACWWVLGPLSTTPTNSHTASLVVEVCIWPQWWSLLWVQTVIWIQMISGF